MKQSAGSQLINLDSDCGISTIVHELLHAAGFWHEQSRPDRDEYVEILTDNIAGKAHNFNKKRSSQVTAVGPYNFASVMHYSPWAFGRDCIPIGVTSPDCRRNTDGSAVARTIRARAPGNVIERDHSLASDADAINSVYPATFSEENGANWGNTHYATAVAIGDVDGDGRGEIIVGRFANDNSRFIVYDDAGGAHRVLASGPSNWGGGVSVTDVAVGDVDGDGIMEIGVTRRAGSSSRFYVYRYDNGQLHQVFAGGDDRDASHYATSIAFGDVDGDGRDEMLVGRAAASGSRFHLRDDQHQQFTLIDRGGNDWGSNVSVVGVQLADVDRDGRAEIIIARDANAHGRYYVFDDRASNFEPVSLLGAELPGDVGATGIAAGDMNGDGTADIAVTFDERTEGRVRFEWLYLNP